MILQELHISSLGYMRFVQFTFAEIMNLKLGKKCD
jgi:hypothetical protein